MNYTSAALVIVGTCFDVGTWWYSKNFKIFDDKEHKSSDADQQDISEAEEVNPLTKNGVERTELTVLMKEQNERE